MAILHDGTIYVSGQGARMAQALRDTELPPESVAREVAHLRKTYVESPYAEGFGADVVVADLIVRGLLTDRVVALALLG